MPRTRTAAKTQPKPYHHGDLRSALLTAADRILEVEGLEALTLRAAARAVGVSHTAPQNHFGDLSGLLSELAAIGYHRFADSLAEAARASPRKAMDAMGSAYVAFARKYPGMFSLMFRSAKLDHANPALREGAKRAGNVMRDAAVSRAAPNSLSDKRIIAQTVARWSLVHGYAMLTLDGQLDNVVPLFSGKQASLLDAVLEETVIGGPRGAGA